MPQVKPDELVPGLGAMLAHKPVFRMAYNQQLTSITSTNYATFLTIAGVNIIRPSIVKLSFNGTFRQWTDTAEYGIHTFYEKLVQVGLQMYAGKMSAYSMIQVCNSLILARNPGVYDYYVKIKTAAGSRVDFIESMFILEVFS